MIYVESALTSHAVINTSELALTDLLPSHTRVSVEVNISYVQQQSLILLTLDESGAVHPDL